MAEKPTGFETSEESPVLNLSQRQGRKLFDEAMKLLDSGLLHPAKMKFEESVKWHPTAEAYTHLAWVISFEHKFQDAIDLCQRAIALDPDYGNPYNDIGLYYMKLGDLDSAEPWLTKAKRALKYERPQAPYLNMGRIFLSRCQFTEALKEFEEALHFEPDNVELRTVIERIRLRNPK